MSLTARKASPTGLALDGLFMPRQKIKILKPNSPLTRPKLSKGTRFTKLPNESKYFNVLYLALYYLDLKIFNFMLS